MSGATICGIGFTPTHDGQTALVVELDFGQGSRSKVQIEEADGIREVLQRARVRDVRDLVGLSWSVLDVRRPQFGIPTL
ncbi:hypothetical protein [Sphingobium tyrosinilyticum]|uniref:Uncharacterized protein n=1 Tax=Sphingobium tyrosinilyticum TaxID=2715436 RepID=A0ABV9F2B8_9SPHN